MPTFDLGAVVGPQGVQGATGPQGPQGVKGDKGEQGEQGTQGPQGIQGPKGDTGAPATVQVGTVASGPSGSAPQVTNSGTATAAVFNFVIPKGDQGPQGAQGPAGPQGKTGAQGPQGIQGPKGDAGETGVQGIQGPQGVQGPAGADGVTPNIQVGTTTTLAAGSSATVTRRAGSPDTAPIFDFAIPKGHDAVNPGDMRAAVYDPQNKAQDVFAYAEQKIAEANTLPAATATKLGLAGGSTVNNALDALGSHYGTCSTAAATEAKVVTLSGFTLATGAVVAIKFTYANTAASPTLNVNGTGAKSIAVYGSTAAGSGAWSAGEIVQFAYDGTQWVMISGAILGTGNGIEVYTGTYVGDGEFTKTLAFPKQPFLIMWTFSSPSFSNTNTYQSCFVTNALILAYSNNTATLKLKVNGNTITFTADNGTMNYINANNRTYGYIAFANADGTRIFN